MQFKSLTHTELLERFGRAVQTERKITAMVVQLIAEIDARKLYLEKAYPSLFDFLVSGYGYSTSAAMRRISAARLVREIPQIANQIEEGKINLTQLSQVQQAAKNTTAETKTKLIEKIAGATHQETEQIIAQVLDLPIPVQDKQRTHANESVTLTFTFTKEQMQILQQAKELLSHAVPSGKWSEIIAHLCQREVIRRTKNPAGRSAVPVKTRRAVFNQQQSCQFVDPGTGKDATPNNFCRSNIGIPFGPVVIIVAKI